MRKSEKMRYIFGDGEGTCKDCCHYIKYLHRDRTYSKCIVYGVSNSEATDWSYKHKACGMKNEEWNTELMAMDIPIDEPPEILENQILFDFGGENE